MLLQLVYDLVLEIGSKKTAKPIYVIASDTQVEAPNIEDYLADRLMRIKTHAKANGLPVHVETVQPKPAEGFWGNLIGKGYPPPTRWFRWYGSLRKSC